MMWYGEKRDWTMISGSLRQRIIWTEGRGAGGQWDKVDSEAFGALGATGKWDIEQWDSGTVK
jgi:hypothetical protein